MLTDERPSVHSIKNSAIAMRRNVRQGAAGQYTRADVNWRSWPHVLGPLGGEGERQVWKSVNFCRHHQIFGGKFILLAVAS